MSTTAALHILALAACLAANIQSPATFQMPGMRRAMQTVAKAHRPVPSLILAGDLAV